MQARGTDGSGPAARRSVPRSCRAWRPAPVPGHGARQIGHTQRSHLQTMSRAPTRAIWEAGPRRDSVPAHAVHAKGAGTTRHADLARAWPVKGGWAPSLSRGNPRPDTFCGSLSLDLSCLSITHCIRALMCRRRVNFQVWVWGPWGRSLRGAPHGDPPPTPAEGSLRHAVQSMKRVTARQIASGRGAFDFWGCHCGSCAWEAEKRQGGLGGAAGVPEALQPNCGGAFDAKDVDQR